jgi:hypothetical protein
VLELLIGAFYDNNIYVTVFSLFAYICIAILEIQLSEGDEWDSINRATTIMMKI